MKKLYQEMAGTIGARQNCIDSGSDNWRDRHEDTLEELAELLPSGSDADAGNSIDYAKSSNEKIVINSAFHCTDDAGCYTGWVKYRVVITASLQFDFNVSIRGNFSANKNAEGLADYLHDVYDYALRSVRS